jgi:hypothetical protein
MITELKQTLQNNSASIRCSLGGGQHRYLALVVSEAIHHGQ